MNFTIVHFAGPVSYDASNFMDPISEFVGDKGSLKTKVRKDKS